MIDEACTDIENKKFLPDEFKDKDEYISQVLGIVGLLIYKFVLYVDKDLLNPNFSLFTTHIYRQENYYTNSDYWKDKSCIIFDGISYIRANWKFYILMYAQSDVEFSFLYSNSIKNDTKSMHFYSKEALKTNPRLILIWFDSPFSFDVSINYFKFQHPQVKIHRVFLE